MILDDKAIDGLMHFDDASAGAYTFPLLVVAVTPHDNASVRPGDFILNGKVHGRSFHLDSKKTFRAARDIRVLPGKTLTDVRSWFSTAPSFAVPLLIQALPGFWLNRARLSGHFLLLRSQNEKLIELSEFLESRRPQREQLAGHSVSLGRKLWALRYHRQNFRDALEEACHSTEGVAFQMIKATAEYAAHSATMYSILEELAMVIALLDKISQGAQRPSTFHDLYKTRSSLDSGLREVLASATWYDGFRQQRANMTHSFAAVVHFDETANSFAWFQRCDRRFFPESRTIQRDANSLRADFDRLVTGFDGFMASLSVALLSRFHPFDIVTVRHKDPREEGGFNLLTVWTREVTFDTKYEKGTEAEVIIDPSGSMSVRTTNDGGLVLGPAAEVIDSHQ